MKNAETIFLQQINDYKFIDSEISLFFFFFYFFLFEKIPEDIGFVISDLSKSDDSKANFQLILRKQTLEKNKTHYVILLANFNMLILIKIFTFKFRLEVQS